MKDQDTHIKQSKPSSMLAARKGMNSQAPNARSIETVCQDSEALVGFAHSCSRNPANLVCAMPKASGEAKQDAKDRSGSAGGMQSCTMQEAREAKQLREAEALLAASRRIYPSQVVEI